ncbi:649_t:CDS:2, partial [Ambispora leptoticha]
SITQDPIAEIEFIEPKEAVCKIVHPNFSVARIEWYALHWIPVTESQDIEPNILVHIMEF